MALTTRAGKALTAVGLTAALLVSGLLTVAAAHASAATAPIGLPICDTASPCPLDLLGGNQPPAQSDSGQSHAYGDPAEPAALRA